jgi:hypothetical protein
VLKTHELSQIIADNLSDYESDEWEELIQVQCNKVSHDTIEVNFIEFTDIGYFSNRYKVKVEPIDKK